MVDQFNKNDCYSYNAEIIEEEKKNISSKDNYKIEEGAQIKQIDKSVEEFSKTTINPYNSINQQSTIKDVGFFLASNNSNEQSHQNESQLHKHKEEEISDDEQQQQGLNFLPLNKKIKKGKPPGKPIITENFKEFVAKLNLRKLKKDEYYITVKRDDDRQILPPENTQDKRCTSKVQNIHLTIIIRAHRFVQERPQFFSPEFIIEFQHYFPPIENNYKTIKTNKYFEIHFVDDKNSYEENYIIENKTQLMLEVLTNINLYSEFTKVDPTYSKDDEKNNIYNSEMRERLYKLRLFELIQKLKQNCRIDLFKNWLHIRSITPDVYIPDKENYNDNDLKQQRIDYWIQSQFG